MEEIIKKVKMKLTENFTLDELTKSARAIEHNIDNTPDEIEINNLLWLCQKVLQPVRDHFDKPLIIHSAFRNDALNKLVGGVSSSQHRAGQAADFHIDGTDLKEVYLFIIREIKFDQVIWENGQWVHVSFTLGKNRNQKLVGKLFEGKMYYEPYISIDQLR